MAVESFIVFFNPVMFYFPFVHIYFQSWCIEVNKEVSFLSHDICHLSFVWLRWNFFSNVSLRDNMPEIVKCGDDALSPYTENMKKMNEMFTPF